MTKPIILLIFFVAGFELFHAVFGYDVAYQVGYGAFATLAAFISLTFLWLWARRSTPLALGMAFGWAGAASVMAWWWMYNVLDRPAAMVESSALFLFLSIYFVGAIQHLEVIGRSFGVSRRVAMLPVVFALVVSAVVASV